MNNKAMTRQEILDSARDAVCGVRDGSYGAPEDNLSRIARLWSDYLGVEIAPHSVADMMILLKVARNASGVYTADNWVDIAGYAACGGEMCSSVTPKWEEEAD